MKRELIAVEVRMMKKLIQIACIVMLLAPLSFTEAQLKSQARPPVSVEDGIRIPGVGSTSLGLSWLNSDRFSMNQSYSLSYSTFGSQSASMGMYQNNMSYIFSDKLVLNGRFGFMHDPLKLGNNTGTVNPLDNLIYGADLTYKPTENVLLNIRFDKVPSLYRYGYYPYRSALSYY